MIVDNLYVVSICIPPNETDTVLVVDADGVLPFSISCKRLQAVVGRDTEIIQSDGRMEHRQLSRRNPPQIGRNASALPRPPKPLGIGVAKAHDHA